MNEREKVVLLFAKIFVPVMFPWTIGTSVNALNSLKFGMLLGTLTVPAPTPSESEAVVTLPTTPGPIGGAGGGGGVPINWALTSHQISYVPFAKLAGVMLNAVSKLVSVTGDPEAKLGSL